MGMNNNYKKTESTDKKFLLVIFIIIVLLIVAIISIAILNKNNNNNNENTTTTTVETTTEITTKKEEKKTKKEEKTTTNKKKTTTKATKVTKTTTTTTVYQFSNRCPEGYSLDDDTCISIKDPAISCPIGYSKYNDNICVNTGDKSHWVNENDTCPAGYMYAIEEAYFGANEYYCYPIEDTIKTCDKGYSLDNDKCVRKVLATRE